MTSGRGAKNLSFEASISAEAFGAEEEHPVKKATLARAVRGRRNLNLMGVRSQ
jgi:hypothetical protein